MKTFLRAGVLLACLTFSSGACAQSLHTISLPGGGKLQVLTPMGYSFQTKNNADGSVSFTMDNPVWGITIQAVVGTESDPNVTKTEWQQNKLISFISSALTIAKEKDYTFKPLNPDFGSGVYCTFSSESGADFLTAGLRAWRGHVLVFRFASSSLTSEEYLEAFNVFRTGIVKK